MRTTRLRVARSNVALGSSRVAASILESESCVTALFHTMLRGYLKGQCCVFRSHRNFNVHLLCPTQPRPKAPRIASQLRHSPLGQLNVPLRPEPPPHPPSLPPRLDPLPQLSRFDVFGRERPVAARLREAYLLLVFAFTTLWKPLALPEHAVVSTGHATRPASIAD